MIEYEKYYQKGGNYLIPTEIFNELLEENQELKSKIETYEDPEDLTLMFMYCDEKAKDKIKELKKQLEEKENIACNWKGSCLENAGKIEKLENQQKEFISYLENCIKELKKESMDKLENTLNLGIVDITKEILSKYKSIIGGKDEDNK